LRRLLLPATAERDGTRGKQQNTQDGGRELMLDHDVAPFHFGLLDKNSNNFMYSTAVHKLNFRLESKCLAMRGMLYLTPGHAA
jgi:hypothetical protein